MEFEMNLEQTLNEITGKLYGKNIGACTDAQLYGAGTDILAI